MGPFGVASAERTGIKLLKILLAVEPIHGLFTLSAAPLRTNPGTSTGSR
jgi:hypothetical protein